MFNRGEAREGFTSYSSAKASGAVESPERGNE